MTIFKNQKGATALLMTVLVLTAVTATTLAASDIIRNGLIMDREQVNSTKAYFAAEAGAERILWELREAITDPTPAGVDCDQSGLKEYFCFDNFEDIVECNDPCTAPNTDSITLSNGARYKISYNLIIGAAYSTTTLINIGSYNEVQRAVRLDY